MTAMVSIGSAALGGALATVAISVANQAWGLKFDAPEIQAAIQTIFTAVVVGIGKLIEMFLVKAKLEPPSP